MRLTFSSKKYGNSYKMVLFGDGPRNHKNIVKLYLLRYRLPDSKSVENHCKMMDFEHGPRNYQKQCKSIHLEVSAP